MVIVLTDSIFVTVSQLANHVTVASIDFLSLALILFLTSWVYRVSVTLQLFLSSVTSCLPEKQEIKLREA